MPRHPSYRTIATLLAASFMLAACAGTARGVKQSVYQHDAALSLVDTCRSDADAIVVIRYTAVVDENAAAAYYSTFEQHAIGGDYEPDEQFRQNSDRIAQAVMAEEVSAAALREAEAFERLATQAEQSGSRDVAVELRRWADAKRRPRG